MTPIPFKYRDKPATVAAQGQRVTIRFDGQNLTGRYRGGFVQLDQPHPIAVEAGAVLRGSMEAAPIKPSAEARVRHEVREAIGALPDVYLMDNPVGQAEFYDPNTNSFRYVNYGLEDGSPDLVIALKITIGALFVGMELKAPGKAPRKNQVECHRRWRAAGIHVVTVQSGQEALLALERIRGEIRERNAALAL